MSDQTKQSITDAIVYFIAMGFVLVMALSCKAPPISELLKDGVNCKALITMPPNTKGGETVDVAVKIYDCHEVTP